MSFPAVESKAARPMDPLCLSLLPPRLVFFFSDHNLRVDELRSCHILLDEAYVGLGRQLSHRLTRRARLQDLGITVVESEQVHIDGGRLSETIHAANALLHFRTVQRHIPEDHI